jgi:hypothetical protein
VEFGYKPIAWMHAFMHYYDSIWSTVGIHITSNI